MENDKKRDIRSLVKKLNPSTKGLLTEAADIAYKNSNPYLEIEHLLKCWIQDDNDQFSHDKKNLGIKADVIHQELTNYLKILVTDQSLPPSISQDMVKLLENVWLNISTSENCNREIDIDDILKELITNQYYYGKLSKTSPSLYLYLKALNQIGSDPSYDIESKLINPSESTLAKYTVDLTEEARKGKIDPVIGRDFEQDQLIEVLLRRRQNNPILTGDAGVGKTAIVEGLALKIISGHVPDKLKNIKLCSLDLGLLKAGASMKGEIELRFKSLINEISISTVPVILFIDEAHTLMSTSSGQAQSSELANMIKPELARGTLRTIAATTWSEYKKYFEKDAALTRRFQVIKIEEPSLETAEKILESLVPSLEKHHDVKIDHESINFSVRISSKYIPWRQLPDKAISILDTACARTVLKHKNQNISSVDSAAHINPLHDASANGLENNNPENSSLTVGCEAVASVISDWTGVPMSKMLSDQFESNLNLENEINNRVIGQNYSTKIICEKLRAYSAKLEDPSRPIGVFLLTGPSGVGKTETAHAITDLYFGNKSLTVVNMSEYQEAHTVSKLKGAPAGYVGYGQGGVLTEAIRRNPYGLLLLDEIDKAHPDVLDLFLQVFDKGFMEDSEGVSIDFRNTLILMTSNVGEQIFSSQNTLSSKEEFILSKAELLETELQKNFKIALLGRSQILPYMALSKNDLNSIVQLKLNLISTRFYNVYQKKLAFDESVMDAISTRCFSQSIGARSVDNFISSNIVNLLSLHVLDKLSLRLPVDDIMVSFSDGLFIIDRVI
jgi:type VI secretion system protein VasG